MKLVSRVQAKVEVLEDHSKHVCARKNGETTMDCPGLVAAS